MEGTSDLASYVRLLGVAILVVDLVLVVDLSASGDLSLYLFGILFAKGLWTSDTTVARAGLRLGLDLSALWAFTKWRPVDGDRRLSNALSSSISLARSRLCRLRSLLRDLE